LKEKTPKTEDWTDGCGDTTFSVASKAKMSQFGPNTWLGDSGALSHYVNNDVGMFDVTVISEPIKVGNGNCRIATKIGKLKRTIIQKDGTTSDVVLKDFKYVPELWVNLFSIGKALAGGFKIGKKGMMLLYLTKGSFKMTFDYLMATKKGYVMGIDMVPVANSIAKGVQVDINALNSCLLRLGT
jgi:hypothetical protein